MVLRNSVHGQTGPVQRFSALAAILLAAAAFTAPVQANESAGTSTTFAPTVGQAGKDVVWVPTSQALVNQMLDLARITPTDILVDLGSGDGRTVITAAQRGSTARGVEYNPDMVAISRKAAQDAGVTDRATFIQGDIFETNFSDADVLTLFLLPSLNVKLRPTILDMKPGTRVVSNSFAMGDWDADQTVNVTEGCTSYCTALLWIVPANVQGTWSLPGQKLELSQMYQKLQGKLIDGGQETIVTDARLDGENIEFKVNGKHYVGKVDGDKMGGMIDGSQVWAAVRESTEVAGGPPKPWFSQ